MAEFPVHDVLYDPALHEQSTRALLHQSQTNITGDAWQGLAFAAAAFDKAIEEFQEDPRQDPTAAGEAAAKAGLRSEQLGESEETVTRWFDYSYHALDDAENEVFYRTPLIRRERVATQILHGRALGYRAVKSERLRLDLIREAGEIFGRAEHEITGQRMVRWFGGGRWDRYGTMLAVHRAANESRHPDSTRRRAVGIAAVAAWRAVRAKRENVSEPIPADARKEHRDFVIKHLKGAALAGALGLVQPRSDDTKFDKLHKKLVGKILG